MPAHFQTGRTQDIVVELSLPAMYRCLRLVRACIEELIRATETSPIPEDTLYGVQLAVHEVCNNIIEHAYGHEHGLLRLRLSMCLDNNTFVADLYDNGRSFDPTSVTTPNLDEPREEGYGLFLVHQLMDEVSYETQSGTNHWRLRKHW